MRGSGCECDIELLRNHECWNYLVPGMNGFEEATLSRGSTAATRYRVVLLVRHIARCSESTRR